MDQLLYLGAKEEEWLSDEPQSTRHMFRTAKEYIGVTDRHIEPQVNDTLCLIAGSWEPVMLQSAQPTSLGSQTYRLVTHAYVAGLVLKDVWPE